MKVINVLNKCFEDSVLNVFLLGRDNDKKQVLPPKISSKPFDGGFCSAMSCMIMLSEIST